MFDFYFFYAASLAIQSGQNPYDTHTLLSYLQNMGAPQTAHNVALGFPYPPYCLWLFAPLAFVSLKTAMSAWLCVSIGSIALAMYSLRDTFTKLFGWKPSALMLCILPFLFLPLLKTISFGQTSFVPMLGVCLFYYFFSRERNFFLCGLILSLTVFKPHLLAIWLVAVIAYLFQQRKYSIIGGLIVGALMQVVIGVFIYPLGWENFLLHQQHIASATHLIPHTSLNRLWEIYTATTLTSPWNYLTVCIGALCVLIDIYKSEWNLRKSILVYLPFSLVMAPFGWLHDQTILLPCYLTIALIICRMYSALHGILFAFALLCITTAFYSPRFEFLMWILPVALQIAGIILLHRVDSRATNGTLQNT